MGVILRAPLVINKVGITVPVSTISSPGSWHVNKVTSSVAVTSAIAKVQSVGEMVSVQRCLPVHAGVTEVFIRFDSKVDTTTCIQGKATRSLHLDISNSPVWCNEVDLLSRPIHINGAQVFGQDWAAQHTQQGQTNCKLHD